MAKYSTISVPKELHEEIRRVVIEDPRYEYSSVAQFSIEAIKIRLEEIKKILQEEKEDKKKLLKGIIENIKKSLSR
ncbi:MAG: hypothetical protein FE047_00305 [Thermoplasmata archaeon]|nr:MAG: hypothetical protein FE047_00305 [Thermoplasmata archaeon]KAA0014879.1 MAG: hypothetical protein FE041_01705 [Thermoplasmata archaeon]